MRKENRLKDSKRFAEIFDTRQVWMDSFLVLKASQSYSERSRYGMVASRKVGKAVVRNTLKRRMREVMRNLEVKPGWDIVFVLRKRRVMASYHQLTSSVIRLLAKADLYVVPDRSYRFGELVQ
jgi:ribonuclease P protein component